MDIGTLLAHVGIDTGGLKQGEREIKQSVNRVEKDMKRATNSTNGLRKALGMIGGAITIAGIARVSSSLIKMGADFEYEMKTVGAVSRATEQQMVALEAAARKAGEVTEWSARDAAQSLKYMAMAGWGVEKSIQGLPSLLNFATAAGMDLGRASDIFTDNLTAMGMGIEDLKRFSDVLIGTTTRSNTTIEIMGETMKYVAPYANIMGKSVEDLAAQIGTLANAGIKGSTAGTNLAQAYVRNQKAAAVLKTKSEDLIGTLKAAREAHWGVNEVAKKYGLISAKSVLILMKNIDAYEKLYKELQKVNGETDKIAKQKLDTVIGDWKIFRSTVESVALDAFGRMKKEIREGIQEATEYVRTNREKIIEFISDIKDVAVDIGKVTLSIAELITKVTSGWASLPKPIQEMGLVAALVGGAKARAAILLLATALGQYERTTKQIASTDMWNKQNAYIKQMIMEEEARIERLKENMSGLRAEDIEIFGPKYQRDIDEAEERIVNYKSKLKDLGYSIKANDSAMGDLDFGRESAAKALEGLSKEEGAQLKKLEIDEKLAKKQKKALEKAAKEKAALMKDFVSREKEAELERLAFKKWELEQELIAVKDKYKGQSDIITQAEKTIGDEIKKIDDEIAQEKDKKRQEEVEKEKRAAEEKLSVLNDFKSREWSVTLDSFDLRRKLAEQENELNLEKYKNDAEILEQWANTHRSLMAEIDKDELESMETQLKNADTLYNGLKKGAADWVQSVGNDLNEFLWTGKMSFSGLAKSFGQMLTQMLIEYEIIKPIMDAIKGENKTAGGGLGLFSGFKSLFGFGHSGIGASGPSLYRSVSPAAFIGAPKLHDGFMPNEYGAILKKSEIVLNEKQSKEYINSKMNGGNSGNSQGSQMINYNIFVRSEEELRQQMMKARQKKAFLNVVREGM